MKGQTHIQLAVATNLAIVNLSGIQLSPAEFAILASSSAFGGLLPDIDHANSKIGSKLPIISKILKHRGFTHTIWFAIIVYAICAKLMPNIALYVAFGCVSHLVGDILTPMGLRPLKLGLKLLDIHICIPVIQNEIVEKGIGYALYVAIPFLIL